MIQTISNTQTVRPARSRWGCRLPFLCLLLTGLLLLQPITAQEIQTLPIAMKSTTVQYEGTIRRVQNMVMIRTVLTVTQPEVPRLIDGVTRFSVPSVETFRLPAHVPDSLFQAAMEAKQQIMMAQGHFQVAVQLCGERLTVCAQQLEQAAIYYRKAQDMLYKYQNRQAATLAETVLMELERLTDRVRAGNPLGEHFDTYYEAVNSLLHACLSFATGFDDQYRCVVFN